MHMERLPSSEPSGNRAQPVKPRFTNAPDQILSAWTALEVLSPPKPFKRKTDLAEGDAKKIRDLHEQHLPWEMDVDSLENYRTYYQIVLGSLRLGEAVKRLTKKYGDTRFEPPATEGESVLATVVVDRTGMPAREPAAIISSFAWGVPVALRDGLAALSGWEEQEHVLTKGLCERLLRCDANGAPLPLNSATIDKSYCWLIEQLGLDADLVKPPRFCVLSYRHVKSPDPPEPLLLNSFFLDDLARARGLFGSRKATPSLRKYMGVDKPAFRHNLLSDDEAVMEAVAPSLFPLGRWPGKGRHPLALLQQAAVNLAMSLSGAPGVMAVNGPPGTGKTTLLRDVVAANVVSRARQMVHFDDPAKAFSATGEKVNTGGSAWLYPSQLAPELHGYEMLVASSNNKAVENVSAELPVLDAIAEDAGDLRFFKTVSDKLLGRETWGLIAAVLGNAKNRGVFRQTFWWDKDCGMYPYLSHASGTPRPVEDKHPETGETVKRPPRVVVDEDAPQGRGEALRRWQQERERFAAAFETSQVVQNLLADVRHYLLNGDRLREDAECKRAALESQIGTRPGWLGRLFRTPRYKGWRDECQRLEADLKQAEFENQQVEKQFATAARAILQSQGSDIAAGGCATGEATPSELVKTLQRTMGNRLVDESFPERSHGAKQLLAPWFDEQAHRTRDDVFVAAMKVHKAFIAAAAKPLRHNIGGLMHMFDGHGLADSEKSTLLAELWSSLFLVTPVVSTTFASVGRMFGGLPPESLGWLLIDEAGQATPQAAVGALMRTRRAVVVGDPLQVEPVVPLSDRLTQAICRSLDVDPNAFNAPEASVQTLADAATQYMAEFDGIQGSRTVGVPLLVHRRCADPMFSVSNAIAYGNLMVQAVPVRPSKIRDLLGPSCWIDVQGTGDDKWCPAEGSNTLCLLERLTALDGVPDLYIVTPFVAVQTNLRRLIRQSGVLKRWGVTNENWVNERVGTVHTVQGREAEAVIFVLGAPGVEQAGARRWAGGRPNLLNVAATRAKEALYVIGNRELWRRTGVFEELDKKT